MKDKPLIKTFVHNCHYYMYTPYSNNILNITENQYIELKKIEKLGISEYCKANKANNDFQAIISLLNSGFITGPFVEEIKHSATDDYASLVNRGLSKLVLQITQRCNFSCRYCHSIHAKSARHIVNKVDMSWEVAKQSVDFFINHSSDSKAIDIYFYGGEPILKFPLIKRLVEYVEKRVNTKTITYHITTNGSLLTEEIDIFLISYKFKIAISLDGNEERQNWSRKYANGENTFIDVWNNVKKLLSLCNGNYENVMFLPVVFADEEQRNVLDFFSTNGIDRDRILVLNANVSGIDYMRGAAQLSNNKNGEAKVNFINNNAYESISDEDYNVFLEKYANKHAIGDSWHHDGTCVPGHFKLFVNAMGEFYSCENAPECHDTCIGNINDGIDIERALILLNIGKITEEECIHCWAMRFCSMCSLYCIDEEKQCMTKEIKRLNCEAFKKHILMILKKYIECSKEGIK